MFKKYLLLFCLIIFFVPNISYAPDGDECGDCMNQAAMTVCIAMTLCCIFSAERNNQRRIENINMVPYPGQIDNDYLVKKDKDL